jgi:hypothetical protein
MWQTMDILQIFVLINLYTLLGMSLWACFKLNGKGQYKYLLAACAGQLLLVDELGNILGPIRILLSLSYLFFSVALLSNSLVIPQIGHIFLQQKRVVSHETYEVTGQPNILFNELVKEAQFLLGQEEIDV